MVEEQSVQTSNRAIEMLQGALTQKYVAQQIGVNIPTIRHWWLCFLGHSLENKRSRGRKTSVPMPAKLINTKSTRKKHQSTRSISQDFEIQRIFYLVQHRIPLFARYPSRQAIYTLAATQIDGET